MKKECLYGSVLHRFLVVLLDINALTSPVHIREVS